MQPLRDHLVVDFTKYLPGAFAGRELLRLGARVVRVEPPDGDPTRRTAPAWEEALNAGKESVVCDLKTEPEFARALMSRADVILEGFRPGVASRLGIGPESAPQTAVYTAITGFGTESPHAQRAGHDLNYLGYAGVLDDTGTTAPPVQVADLAAGALGAVTQILAALLERARTGEGAHIVVSMTHGSHAFVAHRLGGEPVERMLTGGLACYRIYETADGRRATLAALEPRFFRAFCSAVGRDDLAARQYDADQEALAREVAMIFRTRPLDAWLAHFDAVDACVGPVATIAEAARTFAADDPRLPAPTLGQHTDAWRTELLH